MFSVVNSVLLKPLPYPQSDRLVTLSLQAPGAAGLTSFRDGLLLSPSMFLTFAEHNRAFKSLGVWSAGTANLTGIAQPEEVHVITVSSGLLETLAVPPLAGRWLNADDQKPNGSKSVMIGYGFWQRQFGGQRSVIGQTIRLDTQSWQIVGIMPRGFKVVDSDFDVLRPAPSAFDPRHQIMEGFAWNGVGRLKNGVAIGQADADISSLIPVWMDSWSDGPGSNSHFFEIWRITAALKPLKQQVIGSIGNVLWLVMGTIGMVMLIVCTNVANLLLVRADSRQQELAVRAALGAGRGRIARELIIESLVLGAVGGAAGIAVAYAALRLLSAIGPANLPRLSEISLSVESLCFTAGLVDFFRALLRIDRVAEVLARRTRRSFARIESYRERGTRSASIAKCAGRRAGCHGAGFAGLCRIDDAQLRRAAQHAAGFFNPGASPDHAGCDSAVNRLRSSRRDTHAQNEIADKLAQLPGVSSVGYAADVPMDGLEPNWNSIFVQGRDPWGAKSTLPMRLFNYTSPNYFHTMGSRMIAGREFTWDDVYNQRPVGIISENLARELFGSAQAAIGKQITYFQPMPWHQVIGVVEDARHNGVDAPAPAIVYWPTMSAESLRRRAPRCRAGSDICCTQPARGLGEPHAGDAAGRLANQWRAARQRASHHAGDRLEVPGANFVYTHHARNRRRDSPGPRRHRHLRGYLLLGFAAHARNGHSHRSWRSKKRTALAVRSLRPGAHRCRFSHRLLRSRSSSPTDEDPPVWNQSAGSSELRHGGSDPGCGGRTCKLVAGVSRFRN